MYPAMKSLLVVVVAVYGCTNEPSKLSTATPPATATPTQAAPSGNVEERLARVEKRLDKVVDILEQAMPPAEPDPDGTYAVPIDPIDPVQGPADAKVTIVEGFEFLCPYCYMVNPTVDQILQKYPKDVRLVSKYLIIHGPPAIPPGMVACAAAKQGKFKEMKAALWGHLFKMEGDSPTVQPDQADEANLEKMAGEAGVNVAKMKTDMDSCKSWLASSRSTLAPFGVNGTPAFFINGRYINGAQPFEDFDKLIQEELAKADKVIADGSVKQADYYEKQVVGKGVKKVKGRFED